MSFALPPFGGKRCSAWWCGFASLTSVRLLPALVAAHASRPPSLPVAAAGEERHACTALWHWVATRPQPLPLPEPAAWTALRQRPQWEAIQALRRGAQPLSALETRKRLLRWWTEEPSTLLQLGAGLALWLEALLIPHTALELRKEEHHRRLTEAATACWRCASPLDACLKAPDPWKELLLQTCRAACRQQPQQGLLPLLLQGAWEMGCDPTLLAEDRTWIARHLSGWPVTPGTVRVEFPCPAPGQGSAPVYLSRCGGDMPFTAAYWELQAGERQGAAPPYLFYLEREAWLSLLRQPVWELKGGGRNLRYQMEYTWSHWLWLLDAAEQNLLHTLPQRGSVCTYTFLGLLRGKFLREAYPGAESGGVPLPHGAGERAPALTELCTELWRRVPDRPLPLRFYWEKVPFPPTAAPPPAEEAPEAAEEEIRYHWMAAFEKQPPLPLWRNLRGEKRRELWAVREAEEEMRFYTCHLMHWLETWLQLLPWEPKEQQKKPAPPPAKFCPPGALLPPPPLPPAPSPQKQPLPAVPLHCPPPAPRGQARYTLLLLGGTALTLLYARCCHRPTPEPCPSFADAEEWETAPEGKES